MLDKAKKELVTYGKRMLDEGLTVGTGGNLSVYLRDEGIVVITPSGIDYYQTTEDDIVLIDLDGNVVGGDRKPSSEWMMHTELYKLKSDVNAVVHTHSLHCMTIASLGKPIKAYNYLIAKAGSHEIPVVPYHIYGSPELALATVENIGVSKAAILANHGSVACGADLERAYDLAKTIETLAKLQWKILSIGEPEPISEEEIQKVMIKFGTYGQKGESE